RKHPLRNALTDDGHTLLVLARAVVIREIASRKQGDAHYREEMGPHQAESSVRVFFAVSRFVSLDAELESDTEKSCIPPRDDASHSGAFDSRQLADTPSRLLIEVDELVTPITRR